MRLLPMFVAALAIVFLQFDLCAIDEAHKDPSCCPGKDLVFNGHFSDQDLDTIQIALTIVFKPEKTIPSDEELNTFLPLDGHRGPFGRHFKASARRIINALKLKGFDHWVDRTSGQRLYASSGKESLPAAWGNTVRVILGLNNFIQLKPLYKQSTETQAKSTSGPLPSGWPPFGFFPPQLAEIYGFPHGGLGRGQTIGLVELEPSGFHPEDVQAYFKMIGVTPAPSITVVSVDGAQNIPMQPDNSDVEVCLDLETVGSVAPRAKIFVFFAPSTLTGFYDCLATMLSKPFSVDIASCSFGHPETFTSLNGGTDLLLAFEELFEHFAHQSTVVVASGDQGSTLQGSFDHQLPGTAQVAFPASCPHALAAGGTTLLANGKHTKRLGEIVWNRGGGTSGMPNETALSSTGGGVSAFFKVPDYQSKHNIHLRSVNNGKKGRALPDVAFNADPSPGYNIRVNFANLNLIGGTSAAAPMWAGLIARLNHINGKALGFINPLLYQNAHVLKPITQGSNGQYFAHKHYSACAGLGVPTHRVIELVKHHCSPEALAAYRYEMPEDLVQQQASKHTLLGETYQAPAGALKMGSYTQNELDNEVIGLTFIFKQKVEPALEKSLKAWAQEEGFTWHGERGPFAVRLSAPALTVCKALGVTGFDKWHVGDTPYRAPSSDVVLPKNQAWTSQLATVAGLDTQPLSYTTLSRPTAQVDSASQPFPPPGIPAGLWKFGYFPFELARIYGYPQKQFGKGQSVAVIALAGGFSDKDLGNYWLNMGISKPPVVTWIGVDGATNNYSGHILSDDWIPTADIEIIGTIAPDCSIEVIFAPNTVDGLYDAIATALFKHKHTIISTVWGKPEAQWPRSLMLALDQLIAQGTKSGVTVIASSGSHGSSDGITDGLAHVDFPASSPHVLAVGSTTLLADGLHEKRLSEAAWNAGRGLNATGGGVSAVFPVPEYQKENGIEPKSANPRHKKGRGVPDVSSAGDPLLYPIPLFVDGQFSFAFPQPPGGLTFLDLPCGTVAAPTWAGLVARLKSSSKKRLGLLQPALYKNRSRWFFDITKGSNGAYNAHKGYDLTTGLGVPNKHIVEIVRTNKKSSGCCDVHA